MYHAGVLVVHLFAATLLAALIWSPPPRSPAPAGRLDPARACTVSFRRRPFAVGQGRVASGGRPTTRSISRGAVDRFASPEGWVPMLISHSHRFLFIHVIKTGGVSV